MATSTTLSQGEPSKGFVRKHLENFAEKKLSDKIKRLIFISSVFGLIKQIKEPDDFLVSKLNEVFIIAKFPDAVMFPMYIKNLIWHELYNMPIVLENKTLNIIGCGNVNINHSDELAIANYIVNHSPKWLRYANIEAMKEDILTLFKNLQFITAAKSC